MTNVINAVSIIALGFLIATLFVFAIPSFASAATYAYVNHTGEVQTVTANNSSSAITTAPNISLHSGVILLDSSSDNEIVGDNVSGT